MKILHFTTRFVHVFRDFKGALFVGLCTLFLHFYISTGCNKSQTNNYCICEFYKVQEKLGCANSNTNKGHTNPYTTPKRLVQIWAKSISAGVVHGDALSDIVVVTVCVYVLWTWVDPARGVSAGVELGWGGCWMGRGFLWSLDSN